MIDRCSSSRSGNGWEAVQTAGVRMGWEALVARGGADKQTLQMVPGPPVSVVTDSGRLRPWAQPWTKTSCALRDVCSLVTWERLALLPPPPPPATCIQAPRGHSAPATDCCSLGLSPPVAGATAPLATNSFCRATPVLFSLTGSGQPRSGLNCVPRKLHLPLTPSTCECDPVQK